MNKAGTQGAPRTRHRSKLSTAPAVCAASWGAVAVLWRPEGGAPGQMRAALVIFLSRRPQVNSERPLGLWDPAWASFR